ncbi:hypothetical protein N658DRAFT_503640 [Parathielavia hyrcaniae]|uniref:DH domain-containing protein n=1 Tax=Parathielavia hyrcaniae TaxID=113614 RepID=A0AAN6T5H8_9PEZI|nr:hypothetical protein N658DRAFT_503640 [Parathielavia hyrcaniae]
MDHGSLSDEPVSRSGPFLGHLDHLDHRLANDQQLHYLDHDRDRDRDHDHDHPSPQIPINPYAAANLHAFSANALTTTQNTHSVDDSVDPADFYRSYRSVPHTTDNCGNAAPPVKQDPAAMAVATSTARERPSLRSNGNGTTPKHPAVPTAHRNALRPSQRAASNPVDSRSGSSGNAGARPSVTAGPGSSVRDLKKKFDQPASQSTSSVRKAIPRLSTRDTASGSVNGRSPGMGSGATSQGVPRTTATRDAGRDAAKASASRTGVQRAKLVTADQLSGSPQSFASRISRPRTAVATNAEASKSLTQLALDAGDGPPSSRAVPPRQNGLLFGEILPEQSDSVTPGFGIGTTARPRRTSESSVVNPTRPQVMRSFSDPDVEPPSPTDWYRAADVAGQPGIDHHVSRIPKSQHFRAHSDLAGSSSKLTLKRLDHAATRHDVDSPISPTSPASPTSRLPRLTRRMHDASAHASPGSTRSNSPSTFKHTTASGRSSRQHVSTASRARTPTKNSAAQSKTSKTTPSSSRKPPPSKISTQPSSRPNSRPNSRLNAYVSVPPPKLSPTLRSSRPRQSVAAATTAASRLRAVERGTSPLRQPQRSVPKTDESTPRRRKPSVGAIDFAQRRETIKLAYSKSIRDNQAREARQAAAEKRKKELAAVAKAKVEAEAVAMAALATAAASAAADVPPNRPAPSRRPSVTGIEQEESVTTEDPREAVTASSTPQPPPEEFRAPPEALKLEIPGNLPLEQGHIPLSAVSPTSAVTEFDAEVQTEPPRQEITTPIAESPEAGMPNMAQVLQEAEVLEQQPSDQPAPPVLHKRASYQYPFDDEVLEQQPPDPPAPPALHKKVSYQYPFDDEVPDDDCGSIKISLDTSVLEPHSSPELTPTRSTFMPEPEPGPDPEPLTVPTPPAEDDEYVPQPYTVPESYETTVTILGPVADFGPLHTELPRATMPRSDLPQADEPAASSTPDMVASDLRSLGDVREPQVGVENLDRLEDFYIGLRLQDSVAVLRDSALVSDPDTTPDGHAHSVDYHRTPDTSHSLTVPGLLAPGNRLSQHSAWTDFSLESEYRDAGQPSSGSHSHEADTHDDGASFRVIPSTGDLSTCASSVGELTHSPELSPLDKSAALSPMLPALPGSQQHLSELPSRDSFTPHSDSESERIASPPSRDPPHPPTSEREIERESTLYLAESRPNSYAYSHDGKADLPGDVSSPPLVSQLRHGQEQSRVSLSDTLYDGQVPLTEKEQEEVRRLRQRQLVIRELIDTEDAFVRDMTVVEEIYKGTAEACPNLDGKTIKLIFRNTDEIIAFHAALLVEFKEGASTVYTPKGRRSPIPTSDAKDSDTATLNSVISTTRPERADEKDRLTALGSVFSKNIEQLKAVHEVYLRSSDHSSKRLVQIQEDETVMVWLDECNQVAKELTTAWNLDSLLIKPMQRITKYPDIITHLLKYTPEGHPDRESLIGAKTAVIDAIDEINKTKKNFELVGQIVSNRKRKESDVRAGLVRAFGKRVDKIAVSVNKTVEDEEYQKLQQQFGDDYLRLQVVLRDVEYYTRNVATYVHEFLQYLSSMELVMRLQPSRDYAHLESKWVQFNVSMRDIEKIALERHLVDVRKHVIEPFEQVIRCYINPSLAMKKRAKRRLDYEKYMALKANGKKVDKQLAELVEQYEALNDTLKKELPKLSAMTAKIGNICLGKFISIQAAWFAIWKEKVKAPLSDVTHVPELSEIVSSFQREFSLQEERTRALGIVNPTAKGRASQSTTDDASSILSKTRSRPSELFSPRGRGLSINSDHVPTLPTPDFAKRHSGQFSLSPASSAFPSPATYYRDYSGIGGHVRGSPGSPVTPADPTNTARPPLGGVVGPPPSIRPSTGRSFDSTSLPRQSCDSAAAAALSSATHRRDSNSTFNSSYPGGPGAGPDQHTRRLSGLFHSALPLPDGPDESARPSRASSRDRGGNAPAGYTVLWLAASLFEFNIETTKHEAGYPYLTYQAGEIFDVIAEKGELWLAKNQDDPREVVGWIWSKHFAKLADS